MENELSMMGKEILDAMEELHHMGLVATLENISRNSGFVGNSGTLLARLQKLENIGLVRFIFITTPPTAYWEICSPQEIVKKRNEKTK